MTVPADPVVVVREFWARMASNDFASVGAVLADGFTCDWPQSGERIRGRDHFARMNAEYPAHGRWTFEIHRLFGHGSEIVSDVGVSDGVVRARAISFFTVVVGRIARLVEFWPDPFPAPAQRAHLVEPIA